MLAERRRIFANLLARQIEKEDREAERLVEDFYRQVREETAGDD